MDSRLLELLVCPLCKGPLKRRRASSPDEVAPLGSPPPLRHGDELACAADRIAFPIRDGIPVMLENEARTLDPAEPV
jgi:uncharacterized protein YbaR (Trm112 family)